MIPSFKASYEVADYAYNVEYLNQGGLYSGVFRKAFLYDRLASDGSINTFAYFEFLTKKEQKLATFNLFVAKNNSFSYVNKNGESEDYIGFRQLNAIMKFLGVEELDYSENGTENIFGVQSEVIYLNSLLNKPLILGFGTEEYQTKNGEINTKIFLDRIFNIKMQSIEEFRQSKEPVEINNFKPRHKALENNNTTNFAPKENQSYSPYENLTKNEEYIEIKDDDEELPF
ncbi:hypothetical protein H2258_06480 [Campylobacter sp. RM9939]|uniref:hypothetical protein n=1 Tax=Campylobacter molothri TaxID=1032242 RepID=UPI00301BA3A4|nr:hypothetical protein [Campylobacter sp. RM9939]